MRANKSAYSSPYNIMTARTGPVPCMLGRKQEAFNHRLQRPSWGSSCHLPTVLTAVTDTFSVKYPLGVPKSSKQQDRSVSNETNVCIMWLLKHLRRGWLKSTACAQRRRVLQSIMKWRSSLSLIWSPGGLQASSSQLPLATGLPDATNKRIAQ